jgi:cytoskeleton protein RodZ
VADASGWLQIRGRGESWVEVRAGSRLVAQRLLRSGETLAVTDAGPLSVVVGKADATEVLVRGQVMDLAAVARNNVARFEAK